MSNWTVVAIPSQDDYIWNLSSEKIPHMTLLNLGENPDSALIEPIAGFLNHIVNTSMTRFGMSVNRRGTLGPSEADVLLFDKGWSKNIAQTRGQMLKNDAIQRLYNSTEQFPEWTPHLTMGYPETPAKKDTRDYPGTTWVSFDKLAFWTGDFTGLEYDLPDNRDMEVSMSEELDTILAHHGVKGQKWGVRRSVSQLSGSRQAKKASKESDKAKPVSADAAKARGHARTARNAGTSKLSNKELQELVTRMNLEQQYNRMTPKTRGDKAKKMIADFLLNQGKQQAQKAAGDLVSNEIGKVMNSKKRPAKR